MGAGRGDGSGAAATPAAAAAATTTTAAMRGACSLLIHEATFEDSPDGLANAADKRHSTAAEALGIADAMPARHTLLTHFSARYPKLPVLKSPLAAAGGALVAPGEPALGARVRIRSGIKVLPVCASATRLRSWHRR
jgi:hypothetical protein